MGKAFYLIELLDNYGVAMPALKRIKMSDLRERVKKVRGRGVVRDNAKSQQKPEEDIYKLELETLYMIGAPAC